MSVEKFNYFAGFLEAAKSMASAVCAAKGGIDISKYPGRFFLADVLEYVVEYGEKMENKDQRVLAILDTYKKALHAVKSDVTPSEKPIYEMTIEEFEKAMNIQE